MTYQIEPLSLAPFAPLFTLSDAALAEVGARRWTDDLGGRVPCRISLQDAEPGDRLILVNHAHLADPTSPYRASGPIFVREVATEAKPVADTVPEMISRRPLSIRVYDSASLMIEGEVIDGADLDARLRYWFAHPKTQQVHVHFAPRGCYLARAVRD
ncbi:DUF1203 domain-containing protein [Brevundimonas sp.]|uniref:DUF1203 domain-containing protein n=1 Tax=Brevundimonas sp. TaxID=1871086 RepID=UPI001A1BDCC7|nr:DUF1203 domain-containing protein [Brevundimonas sp.]MBJ7485730.1 DUF1203 domain-containing protein [Brevundimonas sp.]